MERSPDILVRLAVPRLATEFGQSVFVDDRPGGGSVLGTQAVSNRARMPGLVGSPFFCAFAPPRTPAPVLATLERVFVRYATDADVQRQLRQQGFEPVGSNCEGFAKLLRSEIQRWTKVIARANIKAE